MVVARALTLLLASGVDRLLAQNLAQRFNDAARSDSVSRRGSAADSARERESGRTERGNGGAKLTLEPVSVAGRPGSLEVVGVPVPARFSETDAVSFDIVPVGGARLLGRTHGVLARAQRTSAILVTVASPGSALSGRTRVAVATFVSPANGEQIEVPIEMAVAPTHRIEVTMLDQLVGARRGDVATIRYRAVNFGNVVDTVRLSAQLPTGWHVTAGGAPLQLPIRGAVDGALRVWIPPTAAPGTSMVRIVAASAGAVVSASDVRLEIESPDLSNPNAGPRFTIGSAVSSLTSAMAYTARLQGAIADSVEIDANASWQPGNASASNNLGLLRLGVPVTPRSVAVSAPRFGAALGLISAPLSELTGAYANGEGASGRIRAGAWTVSAFQASPYAYGQLRTDSSNSGMFQGGRVERDFGNGSAFVVGSHLTSPLDARQLDAASAGLAFRSNEFGSVSSELGYRRSAGDAGMGWSGTYERDGDAGSFSIRAIHAPGGAKAFARASDDLSASASSRIADWAMATGSFWRSHDGSNSLGASSGTGWGFGPTLFDRGAGVSLSIQARGSSLSIGNDIGRFATDELQLVTALDFRHSAFFASGSISDGRANRVVAAADRADDALTGSTADLRAMAGANVALGTMRIEASTQEHGGQFGAVPRRSTLAFHADHVVLPITERLRVFVGADVERMAFDYGGVSPLTTRFSISAPVGLGMEISAVAERSPFVATTPGQSGWVTGLKIERTGVLPRLISAGETHVVFRDLNGNGVRDDGEAGVSSVIVHCGERAVVTKKDGRFKCDHRQPVSIDARSLPAGLIAPSVRRDEVTAHDVGLIAMTAVRARVIAVDVDALRLPPRELSRLIVFARDSAGQPWLARDLGDGAVVFDALPPGIYTIDLDASAVEEPLKMRGAPGFRVDGRTVSDIRIEVTGRSLRIRTFAPTQSGGSAASSEVNPTARNTDKSSPRRQELP